MKINLLLIAAFTLLLGACGGDDSNTKVEVSEDDLVGTWKIVKFEGDQDEKMKEMGMVWNDCEYDNTFEFTKDKVGKTDDGIETMKLIFTNGSCEDNFTKPGETDESEWGLSGTRMYIKRADIGGISRSGGFDITSFDSKKMTIKHMDAVIVFEKIN